MNHKSIFIVADYGKADAAFAEVALRLRLLLPDVFIYPQSVPPFDTLGTGFWLYQLGLTPGIQNTFLYSNTAPRKEDNSEQKNNKGEKLLYAKLDNGVELLAVHAGYTFSFIKPHIVDFRHIHVSHEGTQFRSRDNFPQAVAAIVQQNTSILGDTANVETIPDYPTNAIVHIDGYGNIKTTTRLSQVTLQPATPITITLNGQTKEARFTDGSFNVKQGELAFAPGSSGYDDPFMEIFYRGKSAQQLFGNPQPASDFRFKQT